MKLFYKKHKKLCIFSLIGIFLVSIAGTLLHFVYEWSGKNFVIGLFAPVNESTWEHMKLLFFPALIFFIIEYAFLYKRYSHLIRADFAGILGGTLLIPVTFYTYTGIIGTHNLPLDILTFLISVIAAFSIRCRLLLSDNQKKYTFFYFLCILILGACFLIFTYYPPDIALFVSP